MVKVINLTSSPINPRGLGEIKPDGIPAHLEEKTIGSILVDSGAGRSVDTPLIHKRKRIFNLPEPQENTIFVVSLPVAQVAHRSDVFAIEKNNFVTFFDIFRKKRKQKNE
jgi:hypothetical protein